MAPRTIPPWAIIAIAVGGSVVLTVLCITAVFCLICCCKKSCCNREYTEKYYTGGGHGKYFENVRKREGGGEKKSRRESIILWVASSPGPPRYSVLHAEKHTGPVNSINYSWYVDSYLFIFPQQLAPCLKR